MAQRHIIETYGRAPHNRNIWSTATERQTIETYGRHAWPILLFGLVTAFISLLTSVGSNLNFLCGRPHGLDPLPRPPEPDSPPLRVGVINGWPRTGAYRHKKALLPLIGKPLQAKFCGPCTVVKRLVEIDYLISTP